MPNIYHLTLSPNATPVYVTIDPRQIARLRTEGKPAASIASLKEHAEGVRLVLDVLGGEVERVNLKQKGNQF